MSKNTFLLCVAVFAIIIALTCTLSCGGCIATYDDTKYIPEFHAKYFSKGVEEMKEDDLALFVDYSTCISEGQHSPFYQKLVPSFVQATKEYYSIKGNDITKEDLSEQDTYNRLLNIDEVNYADLKSAATMIANRDAEGVLLTDGEFYNPTIAGGNPNNPYLADAFKIWLKKGHDIYIFSEPYVEKHNGQPYNKKRFYFIFTDNRLKNNIYDRIIQTATLEQFPDVQLFHLSADHPSVLAEGNSSVANPTLAAEIKPYGSFEVQSWTVDWNTIYDLILGAVDPATGNPILNGDYIIKGLKIDRNSFGGYKIKGINAKVYNLNETYTSFAEAKDQGLKPENSDSSPLCENFILVNNEEFNKHGLISLNFDAMNLDDSFLAGSPYNYFKIELCISETENVFNKYQDMFSFDLLGQPGTMNNSVVASVEQCLTDDDLKTQMMESPFYTIYIQSNEK